MKIWRLEVDFKKFESFKLLREEKEYLKDFEKKIYLFKKLNGTLDGESIELVEGVQKSDFPKFWSFSGIPMISHKAADVLSSILGNDVELINLKSSTTENFFLINVITVLDAIDYENSIVRKLDTGLVTGLNKHSFKSEVIDNHNIFKVLLNDRIWATQVFVSDAFKNVVEETQLKGFKFVEVWSK